MSAYGAFIGVMAAVCLLLIVVSIIANWKIFEKAGRPGWHAIIPFLSDYDLFDMSWDARHGLIYICVLLLTSFCTGVKGMENAPQALIGIVGTVSGLLGMAMLILQAVRAIKLSKAFGHDIGFGIGLLIVPFIFMLILGFGNSEYIGRSENLFVKGDIK